MSEREVAPTVEQRSELASPPVPSIVLRERRNYCEREDCRGLPRKVVISPREYDPTLVGYVDEWRRKVEREGANRFPRGENGYSLYGSVQMEVEIGANGRLIQAEITRRNADERINAKALEIVKQAAPYAAFSPALAKFASSVVIVRTLNFASDPP